ncbi:hypothetical protein E2C01_060161 [Portunus trituberculatus]|uniref:Uncharacterized protein n=1 Tax=Portunus trituberculatus TaxID=210409 RepID=A0A5B7HAL6_PORTR|nr:hypothetical protein [Portunus trituberculatus]
MTHLPTKTLTPPTLALQAPPTQIHPHFLSSTLASFTSPTQPFSAHPPLHPSLPSTNPDPFSLLHHCTNHPLLTPASFHQPRPSPQPPTTNPVPSPLHTCTSGQRSQQNSKLVRGKKDTAATREYQQTCCMSL